LSCPLRAVFGSLLDSIRDFDVEIRFSQVRVLFQNLCAGCGLSFVDFALMTLFHVVVQRALVRFDLAGGRCASVVPMVEVGVICDGLGATIALQVGARRASL
jgi:hypothetical protein